MKQRRVPRRHSGKVRRLQMHERLYILDFLRRRARDNTGGTALGEALGPTLKLALGPAIGDALVHNSVPGGTVVACLVSSVVER
jgi:hypothetical protein